MLERESSKEQSECKQPIADFVVEGQAANKYIVEIDRAYTSISIHKACFNASRFIVGSRSQTYDLLPGDLVAGDARLHREHTYQLPAQGSSLLAQVRSPA